MKDSNPLVSFVVPCYNSKTFVLDAINSFLATKFKSFEIVIVDDCSTDGTYELITNKFKDQAKVRIMRNKKNFGPSQTRNNGIKNAKGKYVAFLETDMQVDPNWLTPIITQLEKDKKLGAIQSKVLDLNHKEIIQAVGLKYDPHTFWVWAEGCGMSKDYVKQSQEISIGAVGSVVRKSVLDKIGYFDEKIVHNIDDIDLGWRIWLSGNKIISEPKSITYHWTAKPAKEREKQTASKKSEFYFHKTPRVFLKNYEWGNVIKYLPWFFLIFTVRALKNLSQGNYNSLFGLVKATVWNIYMLPDTLRERRRIQSIRGSSDSYIFDKIVLKGSFWENYTKFLAPMMKRSLSSFSR